MRFIISRKDWVDRFIINLLAHHPYGLSSWDISKIIKLPEQNVKYHLKKLESEEKIVKSGRKYVFPYKALIKDGVIIMKMTDGFVLFSCSHFNRDCKCRKEESEGCKYLKELPDNLLKAFKRKKR